MTEFLCKSSLIFACIKRKVVQIFLPRFLFLSNFLFIEICEIFNILRSQQSLVGNKHNLKENMNNNYRTTKEMLNI